MCDLLACPSFWFTNVQSLLTNPIEAMGQDNAGQWAFRGGAIKPSGAIETA